MVGKNTVNLTNIPARILSKLNMTALRIAVLSAFALSVAVTVWSMMAAHNHILHISHVVLATLTFLLIALYLHKSAEIVSLMIHRNLRFSLTVDSSAGFIEYSPKGAPVFNACVGALAKLGIFVKSASSMSAVAKLENIAVDGNSESREGYGATLSTLADMGLALSNDTDVCPVKIALRSFEPEGAGEFDFVLTQDKIAHVLAVVYISRLFVKYSRITLILRWCALAVAAALLVFRQPTYAAAAIALLFASGVIIVHRIIRKTARMTFKSVTGS